MAQFGDTAIDMVRGVAHRDGRTRTLTELELRVLDYFDARRGQVVTREELERQVWGFHSAVQSEAVPVAIRRLRSKIGSDALKTVYGQGWRVGQTAPSPPAPTAPIPVSGRPLFGRQDELERTEDALQAQGRVLLTGPAGVGKTRLAMAVAARWKGTVVQVLAEGVSAAAAVATLADVLGCSQPTPEALEVALAAQRDPLVLVDGADACDADTWAELLPRVRVLLTSRQWSAGSAVPVVHVAPFQADEARRFLIERLASVLPDPSAEGPLLDALVGALDGLPAALEVYAARAVFGVGPVLEELQSQGLSADLVSSLERSWARMDAESRQALLVCAGFRGLFPLEAAVALCGTAALASLRASSLLQHGTGGLYLLEVVRAFCKTRDGAAEARERTHAWIVQRAEPWAATLHTQPGRSLDELRRLRRQLIDVAESGTAEWAARATCALATGVDLTGPDALVEPLLAAVLQRNPPEPWRGQAELHLIRARRVLGRAPDLVVQELALHQGPVAELYRGQALGSCDRPEEAVAAFRKCVALAPDEPTAPIALARLSSVVFKDLVADPRGGLEQGLSIARTQGYPWCEAYVLARLAAATARAEGVDQARPLFQRAVAIAEAQQLHRSALDTWNYLGIALLNHDLASSHAAFARATELCGRIGVDPVRHACAINTALTALLLEHPEESLGLAEVSRTTGFPALEAFCRGVAGAAQLALGQTEQGLATLALCDASALAHGLGQRLPFGEQVLAALRAERHLRELPDPAAEAAVRTVLEGCAPYLEHDTNGLLRALVRRLRARVARGGPGEVLEHPSGENI